MQEYARERAGGSTISANGDVFAARPGRAGDALRRHRCWPTDNLCAPQRGGSDTTPGSVQPPTPSCLLDRSVLLTGRRCIRPVGLSDSGRLDLHRHRCCGTDRPPATSSSSWVFLFPTRVPFDDLSTSDHELVSFRTAGAVYQRTAHRSASMPTATDELWRLRWRITRKVISCLNEQTRRARAP